MTTPAIEVYPVGLCYTLRMTYNAVTVPGLRGKRLHALRHILRSEWHSLRRAVQHRNGRALRNHLVNGYMAEPREWPDGLKRCGTGWTRRRAILNLYRRVKATGNSITDPATMRAYIAISDALVALHDRPGR